MIHDIQDWRCPVRIQLGTQVSYVKTDNNKKYVNNTTPSNAWFVTRLKQNGLQVTVNFITLQ